MAVSTTNAQSGPYLTNGVTVTFPFTFTAPSSSEVDVALFDAVGRQTTLASDYTVAINPNGGGSVTFASAPAAGSSLYVLLDPSFQQDIVFENGSAWRAEPVNEANDRSALRAQALKRDLARALSVPVGDPGGTLPPLPERAGKFLSFDSYGKPIAIPGQELPVGQATIFAPGLMPIVDKIKSDGLVDLKSIGASGTGGTNDRQPLFDAIDAAGEYGSTIRLTGGNYRIDAPIESIPSGILFEGSGKETCYISAPFGDADIMVFGTGATSGFYSGLRNLTVRGTHPSPTAGAGIVFDGAAGVLCENVRSRGHYIAYHWRNNAGTCRLYNSQVEDTIHIGHYIEDATDPWIEGSYSFGIRDGTSARTDIGLKIEQMNGGRILQSSWGLFDTGIAIVPGDDQWCLNTFFDCVETDLNGFAGLNISPTGTGYVGRLKFIAGRFGFTSNGYGVVLDSPRTDGIEFIGGEAERCIKSGVLINGARGLVFSDFVAIGNNWFNDGDNSNSFNGFDIVAGDDIDINGGRAGRYSTIGHTSAVPASQNFGIAIQSSFTGRLTIKDVDCLGNKLGPVVNLSTSTDVTIEGATGYLPSGPVTVPLTGSPFGYTAGASREVLFIRGGTVSDVTIAGISVAASTDVTIPLQAHQPCVITYSSAPTISKVIG